MIPPTEPIDVGDKRGLPVRASARLLIVDPANRVLLFRYHPPHTAPFWSTAQGPLPHAYGSIDDDVDALVAQTGLRARLGMSVDLRDLVYAGADGAPERWIVWTFVVVAEGGEPGRDLWPPDERDIVREHRWWTLDELRATDQAVQPAFLPDLLARTLRSLGRYVVVTDGPVGDMRWFARMPPDHTSLGLIEVVPRDGGVGGLELVEEGGIAWRRVREPSFIDRPLRWAREHDVRNWRVFTARNGRRRVGGAVVAFDTPGIALLQGRRDRAVIRDVREHHKVGEYVQGVGSALLRAAEAWLRAQGGRWLIAESDSYDTCSPSFFAELGYELGAIHRVTDPRDPDDSETPDAPDVDDELDETGNWYGARFHWYRHLGEPREPDRPIKRGSAEPAHLPLASAVVLHGEVTVTDGPMGEMDEYARIPIALEVRAMLEIEVRDRGLKGLWMTERAIDVPWVKDYDEGEERPQRWARRFDVSNWRVFEARSGGQLVGGAVVAFDTPGVDMLEGRRDLAVLWDIRVLPGARGHGIGAALFRAAEAWACGRGCRWLKIETQNINVPACRFYARMGCELGAIDRFAYPDLPDEVQLLWYRDLAPSPEPQSQNAISDGMSF